MVYITRPNLVGFYNKYMGGGGMDLGDENLNRHRIGKPGDLFSCG